MNCPDFDEIEIEVKPAALPGRLTVGRRGGEGQKITLEACASYRIFSVFCSRLRSKTEVKRSKLSLVVSFVSLQRESGSSHENRARTSRT